jgi:signal transduction histidine kinase
MTRQVQRWALLGDIAGKVVHEIRNPLNAIFLHADVIQGELQCPTLDSQPQILDSLTDIRTEVRRLYDIMQDYLALARLAAIPYEPEDMANFLRECGRLMQEQARSMGVVLHLQGLAHLGSVALHQGTLQRAFLNLLQRALDAMAQGGTLTLRGRCTASHSIIRTRYRQCHSAEQCLCRPLQTQTRLDGPGTVRSAKSSQPIVGPSGSKLYGDDVYGMPLVPTAGRREGDGA